MAKTTNRPATPPEGAVEAPQPAEEVTGREDHLGEPEETKDAPQGDGEPEEDPAVEAAPSAPRLRVAAGRAIVTLSGDIAVEGAILNANPDRLDIPAEHVEGSIAAGALEWI